MKYPLSTFGKRLALQSGIGELMQDLGETLASGDPNLCMLGGGQPSHIPAVDALIQEQLQAIAADPERAAKMLGDYQPPAGDLGFRKSVADCLRSEFGWPIDEHHVAVTAGGQTAFFLLFNAIAGQRDDGSVGRILLPLVPEYIGYADQSTTADIYRANRPKIERLDEHTFKYAIDFDSLQVDDDVAAICLSRPTNPSSNVVSDEELSHLAQIAESRGVPLIVDNAYGDPFPGVIFTGTHPLWTPSMILTFSLSKLGLPGTRTGIVVADPQVIEAISAMSAITALANNNVGQMVTQSLFDSRKILSLSRDVIRPYYEQRARQARDWIQEAFAPSIPFRLHRSEGAFFLWLWLEDLPISSAELYRRLKRLGVLVISGHYFFFGLKEEWKHQHECLRISFTAPTEMLRRGIEILADEIQRVYEEAATESLASE